MFCLYLPLGTILFAMCFSFLSDSFAVLKDSDKSFSILRELHVLHNLTLQRHSQLYEKTELRNCGKKAIPYRAIDGLPYRRYMVLIGLFQYLALYEHPVESPVKKSNQCFCDYFSNPPLIRT